MGGFFSLDGPFQKWGTEVADVMILSVYWLFCSIPIFTIGASTSALFYVFGKKVRGEDPYVSRNFFKSFKDNFKQGTILTFILALLWISMYLYFQIITSGNANFIIKVMGLLFAIQVTILSLYIFPMLSRFRMPIKNLIISSFLFGNRHFITSILCLVLFLACFWLATYPTPFAIFAFGVYAVFSSFLFQRVFTKYIKIAEEEEQKIKEQAEIEEIEINTEETKQIEEGINEQKLEN